MLPKRLLLPAAFLVFSCAGPACAQSPLSDLELVRALRTGGTVIVFRHGATNSDMADLDPLNHDSRSIGQHLIHATDHFVGVIPGADNGVSSSLIGMLQHLLKSLFPGFLAKLNVNGDRSTK